MDGMTERRQDGTDADTAFALAARLLAWVDGYRRVLFVGVLVLYAAAFTGRWRVNPDSSLIMSLGRNLGEGSGFVYQGVKHTWFEPGMPLVISALNQMFGEDHYAPILAFILLCSLTALLLTYRLMLRHAGRPTAVLVTLSMALCETCLRYGFQIVTDTPFLVALLVYLLGYERLVGPDLPDRPRDRKRWLGWVMIAVATFLMVTFRPTSITFVGAVGLACAWHVLRGPNRRRHVIIGLLTLASFYSFRFVDPRRDKANAPVVREQRLKTLLTTQRSYAINRVVKETAPGFVEEVLPEAVFATQIAPGINTALSLGVMAAGVALFRRRVLWGAWCGATFFQCMTWLPRERYLLPVLPLLVYGMWRGAVWLASRPRLSRGVSLAVFAALLLLYFGPNLALDLHFLTEQRRLGVNGAGGGDAEATPTVEMALAIRQKVGENDVVFATDHRELSYFSRRIVKGSPWSYRWPPTEAEQKEFFNSLKSAPALWAVLPDKSSDQHVPALMKMLGVHAGEPAATVERPRDRKGRPVPPFVLYPLVPDVPATGPSTAPAADARPQPR